MNHPRSTGHKSSWLKWSVILFQILFCAPVAVAQRQGSVLSHEGQVEVALQQTEWMSVTNDQPLAVRDRLRTLKLSRAMVQLAELGRLRVNELTTLEVLAPRDRTGKATLDLKGGAMYFFSREKPSEFLIQTPTAIGASRGTEFLVEVDAGGRSVFTVFDGVVELTNTLGRLILQSGDQGSADVGQPPVRTAVITATNVVQWWLYYPGVLDADELPLEPTERTSLAASLSAWRAGDPLAALANFPAGRISASGAERAYHAGLLLSVGQAEQAEALLSGNSDRFANALRRVIAAVGNRGFTNQASPTSASEWLAQSYEEQARLDLKGALKSARAAIDAAPDFGFAHERVAELEFGAGETVAAKAFLDRALELSPRNAQALALRGFVASAENRIQTAIRYFEQAIAADPALGNAWLGRGLCRIRLGDTAAGLSDLETAAALEPNRSVLHSYLGKAFSNAHDAATARRELDRARTIDPNDPTAWLYSALLNQEERNINAAVYDLEESLARNDNRSVYRSRLLLDQDRAVRGSSLAKIYQAAGMNDVSVREAARAVAADYGNFSAHLFLADSFNALRDPTRFNLRYETGWFNELLLANLLAPVGGGSLSQNVSQQEYSKLFEADRLGFASSSEARSDQQYHQTVSQFGTVGNTSYSLDVDYQFNHGVRPNNELSRLEWFTKVKQQLTAQDSALLLLKYQNYHSGDNFQYYDPSAPGTLHDGLSYNETQTPLAVAGYHREWAPGIHTLFLGGRLENDQDFSDLATPILLVQPGSGQPATNAFGVPFDIRYRSRFETYTAELNQILQFENQTVVFGGRVQNGTFETTDLLTLNSSLPASATNFFLNPPAMDDTSVGFERASAYGYYTWEIVDDLLLTGGVAYDYIAYPLNHRLPPVSDIGATRRQVSPKAALVWSIVPGLTLRGIFSRSLGGVSFDESFRLEPTQLAGFDQAFRTVINESIAGSVSAPQHQVIGGALDFKAPTHTYFGIQGELIHSRVDRLRGVFDFGNNMGVPAETPERLDYTEGSIAATFNQLVGDHWSFGLQYKVTRSRLHTVLSEIPASVTAYADRTEAATFHQVSGQLLFSLPCGFFARGRASLYAQDNLDYSSSLPGDTTTQLDVYVGWRFRRLRGDVTLGVLNLLNEDYRLNPLSSYLELPRERVYTASLRLNF